jgi:hypothetical protein
MYEQALQGEVEDNISTAHKHYASSNLQKLNSSAYHLVSHRE